MSNPTTPFSWQMPTATDLVTDLPADFEVFGQAVATSMADLLGGTTGQVLAKNSATDMDFVWTTANPGDITGVTAGTGISGGGTSGTVTITNSMATEIAAKGDLIVGTGSATFDNLTAGSNGETLVADSSTSTGLRYQGSQAAAKNYLINGAMDFWQRGTSSTSLGYVTADRWYINNAGGTTTSAQETTTVPSVARYALKLTQSVSSAQVVAQQPLESQLAIPLANQTIIVSAYVAASASTNFTIDLGQSTSTDVAAAGSWTFTSGSSQNVASLTYVRVSQTFTVSGTSKSLMPRISMTSLGSGNSFYLSGVQMEISAVPTQFTRAGGTIQGEFAACQRYYQRFGNTIANGRTGFTMGATNGTQLYATRTLPVTMRTGPTSVDSSLLGLTDGSNATIAVTSGAINSSDPNSPNILFSVASGLTQFRVYEVINNNNSAGYIALSAEL